MEKRLTRLESMLGRDDDGGQLALTSSNAWSDEDQALWQKSQILHDQDLHDDLIEKYTGHRPCRRPGLVSVIDVPAPQHIEEADEATRAIWREQANARAWRP
jgi:hypothetical protein